MADPAPIKAKVMTPGKKPFDSASRLLPSLVVRFNRSMKRQRVYPLIVSWSKDRGAEPGGEMPALVVRPIIPGAIVVPAEMFLGPTPAASASFYVTPLARGRLAAARVEALNQGRVVDTVPLKIKVVRWSLAQVLFVLAFLVPLVLIFTTRQHKLTGEKKLRSSTEKEQKISAESLRAPQKLVAKKDKNGNPLKKNDKSKEAGEDASKESPRLTFEEYPKPGEVLSDILKAHLPKIDFVTDNVAEGLGQGYQFVCDAMQQQEQLCVYGTFVVLLALSILLSTSARGVARSEPLALARAPG